MGRRALPILLVLSAVFGTTCGLPDPFFLSPPTVPRVASALDYGFQLQTTDRSAEPEFRGYELYYKIYADYSSAQAEANLGGGDPGVSQLTAKGFLPVTRGPAILPASGGLTADTTPDFRSAPLIPIATGDRSSAFTITITFNPANLDPSWTAYSYTSPTTGAVEQEMDRYVAGIAGCKPFTFGQGNYAPSDPDIVKAGPLSSPIFVAMYVVSYGLQDLSTPIYSYPVYMGYLSLSGYP
jgi:hypothetical protein